MTVGKEYEVIGIEADSYRVIADDWQPYLYEPEEFEVVDSSIPEFWVKNLGDEGELYAYPMVWFYGCFFERFFDREPGVEEKFWSECKRLYGIEKST